MENKSKNTSLSDKISRLKPLSKEQLETIVGGPETSRGTTTSVDG
ncbi:hypothetical protein [Flavobacterium collinsii]|nr:hypothetical protein [Flavobacterium collinsii]